MSLLNNIKLSLNLNNAKAQAEVEAAQKAAAKVKVYKAVTPEEDLLLVQAENAELQIKDLGEATTQLDVESEGVEKAAERLEAVATATPIAVEKFTKANERRLAATERANKALEALKELGF